jgi:hypothetical protein
VDLAAVRALLDQVAVLDASCGSAALPRVEWSGRSIAKGVIRILFGEIQPETFFFVEQFLYQIRRANGGEST